MDEVPCPKCGSSERVPDVQLLPWKEQKFRVVEALVYRHPAALLRKGAITTPLRAIVCGECGFTELYVAHPDELLAAYRESQSSGEDG